MLTEVKNQIKVIMLSVKYNIMRQMVNKVTFITNIVFMILNNAGFIIQWVILFSLKENIGGYNLNEVILLWGLAASVYGLAHIIFKKAFEISDLIINGKLDSFIVQPKNIFLSVITSDTTVSAIGDWIYGYICLAIYGITLKNFILFTFFTITGAIILTSFASNFATYPGTIFKKGVRIIMYTLIPVGIANYMPVDIILNFNLAQFIYVIGFTILITTLAFVIFYRGLKRYSSSNLMSSRI